MKKIILLFALILVVCIISCASSRNSPIQKQENLNELLIGKWRSESDSLWTLIFEKQRYSDIYDKDKPSMNFYKLSASCNLKDTSAKISLQSAYLLFLLDNGSIEQCNEILNLDAKVLSWMNSKNGRIFVFHKVK
jgi:hypothetical protein